MSFTAGPLDLGDDATLAELVTLQRASYRVEADLIGAGSLPTLAETPEQLRASGESFLGAVGAADGGAPGAGRLLGAVAWKRDADTVDIHRLMVHPEAFRRGVASGLLDALDEREAGARRWIVGTAAANRPALALYERRGFAVAETLEVPGGIEYLRLERLAVD